MKPNGLRLMMDTAYKLSSNEDSCVDIPGHLESNLCLHQTRDLREDVSCPWTTLVWCMYLGHITQCHIMTTCDRRDIHTLCLQYL